MLYNSFWGNFRRPPAATQAIQFSIFHYFSHRGDLRRPKYYCCAVILLPGDIKTLIKDGYLNKPCIKCGNVGHSAAHHPRDPVPLRSSVWLTLKGPEMAQAEALLARLRTAKQNFGKASSTSSSAPSTAANTTEPIIAPTRFPLRRGQ